MLDTLLWKLLFSVALGASISLIVILIIVRNALNEIKSVETVLNNLLELITKIENTLNLSKQRKRDTEKEETSVGSCDELLTLAEESYRLLFRVKDVYTPRIEVMPVRSLEVLESHPFKKKIKKALLVETDTVPSWVVFTLGGEIEKFGSLKVIVNKGKKSVELSKTKNEEIIELNKPGRHYFDLIIAGIPNRVDSDTDVSILLRVKVIALQQITHQT